MKIEKTPLENHEIKLDVTVDAEEFEPYCKKAARKIAGSTKIPGFRPGKAPYEIVKRQFGDLAIAQEALDIFIDEKYSSILNQAEVEPSGMGKMDKIDQVNPPIFSIIVPLKTEVELGDYRAVREDFKDEPVTEEDFKKSMDNMKKNFATAEPSEEPAVEGQTVYALIKAETEEPTGEDGSTELIKEMPYEFTIGQDTGPKSSWPYANFTKCLVGAKPGDVVTTEYTFPEDSTVVPVRGKKATFTVTVQSVKKLVMPEENDELAKKFGNYETFQDFAADLRKHLEKEKADIVKNEYADKVIKKIVDGATVTYSPNVLEDEIQERLHEIEDRLSKQGINLETYLKLQKTDLQHFIDEKVKPDALVSLKQKIVLQEIASKEKISIDFAKAQEIAKDIRSYAMQQANQLKTKKERDQLSSSIMQTAFNESFMQSLMERISAIGKGENPQIEEPKTAEQAAEEAAKAAVENATGAAAEIIDSTEVLETPEDKQDNQEKPEA